MKVVGIFPDIEVPATVETILNEADEILGRAIETARANRR